MICTTPFSPRYICWFPSQNASVPSRRKWIELTCACTFTGTAASSRILTTSNCPARLAMCKAVLPLLVARVASAPRASSSVTTSKWPSFDARCSAFRPPWCLIVCMCVWGDDENSCSLLRLRRLCVCVPIDWIRNRIDRWENGEHSTFMEVHQSMYFQSVCVQAHMDDCNLHQPVVGVALHVGGQWIRHVHCCCNCLWTYSIATSHGNPI